MEKKRTARLLSHMTFCRGFVIKIEILYVSFEGKYIHLVSRDVAEILVLLLKFNIVCYIIVVIDNVLPVACYFGRWKRN